jgi:hypothetical protein
MAVTRIWPVRGQLDKPIEYAMNPEKTAEKKAFTKEALQSLNDVMNYAVNEEKTEQHFYVKGINCNASTARQQFISVKKKFKKEGGIVAYHCYQSFAPGEATPKQAHEIGVEFAKRVWKEDYQVVVGTHLNTKCLHNHLVVNSVSRTHGRRCQTTQWWKLRKISDEICKEYGLSVVKEPKSKKMPYPVAIAESKGEPTRLMIAKEAVDEAIRISATLPEFHQALKTMGYTCHFESNRKHWTIRQRDWKRPIRLYRLGEDYTKERIVERVNENPSTVRGHWYQLTIHKKKQYNLPTRYDRIKKMGGLGGLYLHYCYRLGYLPKYNRNPKRVHYMLRDDLLKMNKIAEETRFICRNGINTEEQLNDCRKLINENIQTLINKRNEYYKYVRRRGTSQTEVKDYKDKISVISEELKTLRKEARLCDGITERSGIIEKKLEQVIIEEVVTEKQMKRKGGAR